MMTTIRIPRTVKHAAILGLGALLVLGSSIALFTNQVKAAACTPPTTDYGTATSTVKIDNTATYTAWSQMLVPNTADNSYLLEIDGTNCYVVGDGGITPGAWTWTNYQNGNTASPISLNLTAGNHTIKMVGREPSVQLGRILFLSDASCVPTGTGSNCTIAADTTPPTVSVTGPGTNASVSGTVNVTASATDNTGVAKVEFYINGILTSTDTSSPYSYAWNTTTASNGPNTLTAKAYDAAGNTTSSDTVQVTVNNTTPSDTQAPSTPTQVSATANAYNKVTVTWKASTDNVGVVGYVVSRNNVPVADVTNATQYVDNTVLPATKYTYQISAYDAAKNSSAASGAATVTTPSPSTADTQAPTAPRQVTARAVNNAQINVSWRASTDNVGVAAYDVYRSLGNGGAAKIATVTTTNYGDTNLAAGTKYSYYVKARDAAGNVSPASNTDTEKTTGKSPKIQTGVLKGKVSYSNLKNNRPKVVIWVDGHREVYTVNSKGNYTIPRLPVGEYEVAYTAKGARTQRSTVTIKADKATTKNVKLHK